MSAKPTPPNFLPAADDILGIVAFRIRTYRVAKEWSQEDLGLEADLDRTYISGIERKVWNMSLTNLKLIANALGREPWEMLIPVDKSELQKGKVKAQTKR